MVIAGAQRASAYRCNETRR